MKIPFLHNINNKVFVNTYVDTRLMDFEQDKTDYLKTIQDLYEPREQQTEMNSIENSEIIKAIPAEGPNTFQLYKDCINQSRTEKHKRNYSEEIIQKEIVNLFISHMEEVLKIIYINKESKKKVTTIMTELKNLETMTEKADYIKNTPSIPNII